MLPDGLRHDHATAPDVWARILIAEGRLSYQVPTPDFDEVLIPFFLKFFAEPK
jgi:tellurite resistance-related uncharacterized protein